MKCGNVTGKGNTATVYEWEEGKVLKLFYQGCPKEAVECEFYNARAVSGMAFSKPKAHGLINYQDRMGIIYDRVKGESLLDWVLRTHDLRGCAVHMAKLHKTILRNRISNVYLVQMNVTRELIQDYLSVIITARAGECPNE